MLYNYYHQDQLQKTETERLRMAERLIQEDLFFEKGIICKDNRYMDIYDERYQNAKDGVFD